MENGKILYVDDEDVNLFIFEVNLGKKFNVITASSGKQGLEVLDSNPGIAVVVTDMRMPLMDGLEFVRVARERFTNLKFYMLSAFDINEEIQKAIKEGLIRRYFQKPLNLQEIESELVKVLAW